MVRKIKVDPKCKKGAERQDKHTAIPPPTTPVIGRRRRRLEASIDLIIIMSSFYAPMNRRLLHSMLPQCRLPNYYFDGTSSSQAMVLLSSRCHFKSSLAHHCLRMLTHRTNHSPVLTYIGKLNEASSLRRPIILCSLPTLLSHQRKYSSLPNYVRYFSTQQDLDFDIPPLDLTTPSSSIPLPPNYIMANAHDPKPESALPPTDRTSEQASSFLSDTVKSMEKSLELDGELALTYRAQVLSELEKKDQQRLVPIDSNDESSHDVVESSSNIVNRNALLSSIKAEINKHIDQMWPRYKARKPPQITDRKRLARQKMLVKNIQRIENEILNSKDEDSKLIKILGYEMRDLRRLVEYGITSSQFSRIKKQSDWKDHKNRPMILRELQAVHYGRRSTARPRRHLKSSPSLVSSTTVPLRGKARNRDSSSSEISLSPSSTSSERSPGEVTTPLMEPVTKTPTLAELPQMPTTRSSGVKYPATTFTRNLIKTQADGTILGSSGATSVLCTVILDSSSSSQSLVLGGRETINHQSMPENLLQSAIDRANAQSGAGFIPLQVDFRQRYHAIGKIPSNKRRRDNSGPLSDQEILAARVIDRTIRPWLLMGMASSELKQRLPENIVVSCEVQSYDPRPCIEEDGQSPSQRRTHSDPTVLAVNSAIAALYQSAYSSSTSPTFPIPSEAAACVKLAIQRDGTIIFNPTPKELQECKFELLYAGTKDRALMLEFFANAVQPKREDTYALSSTEDPGIPESTVAHAIQLAHDAILPMIEMQEKLRDGYIKKIEDRVLANNDETLFSDEEIAQLLGFESQIRASDETGEIEDRPLWNQNGSAVLDEAKTFVWSKLERGALKLFGHTEVEDANSTLKHESEAHIHEGAALLPKQVRGRRENIIQSEIARVLRDEFVPRDDDLAALYRSAIANLSCLNSLSGHIHECIMKKAMSDCTKRNFRADGRFGVNVVRPISAVAPILPDSVHGSALFSRGETQVMCTATLVSDHNAVISTSIPPAKRLIHILPSHPDNPGCPKRGFAQYRPVH